MSNNTKKYIVDTCNYIDVALSVAFFVLFFRCLFYLGDGWEYTAIAFAGVLVWPNKKYWAKWLQVDMPPKELDIEILAKAGYRVTELVKGEENKILVVLEKEKQ